MDDDSEVNQICTPEQALVLAAAAPAFPEELHLPLLFNSELEEAREAEDCRLPLQNQVSRNGQAIGAPALPSGETTFCGIFADPLAFLRR